MDCGGYIQKYSSPASSPIPETSDSVASRHRAQAKPPQKNSQCGVGGREGKKALRDTASRPAPESL